MPMYEHFCSQAECPQLGRVIEGLVRHWYDPNPDCEVCGKRMVRLASRFAVVFTKPLNAYNDLSREGAHEEGHWVTRRNTPDGVERQEYITTREQQKAFCRDEGLWDPSDIPPNAVPGAKSWETSGMPGQWASCPDFSRFENKDVPVPMESNYVEVSDKRKPAKVEIGFFDPASMSDIG